MSTKSRGKSLYYATDKNVFDALNEHKVDSKTIHWLFVRRNILVGKHESREDLARYFSRLTHDYYDHKEIASRLGVSPRRERVTSLDVRGIDDKDKLLSAINAIKGDMESHGDVVQLTNDGDKLSVFVQYEVVDYKKNEFNQVQIRDGTIEFVKTADGYVVRNTHNDYMNAVKDTLLEKVEQVSGKKIEKTPISLVDIPPARLRSKFFHELVNSLPGYIRSDVTDVYVYKPRPATSGDDGGDADEDDSEAAETHVERVFLRGKGVTRSELLNELLDEDGYYITRIGWISEEELGSGDAYDIEATFSDPRDCVGFSFILSGVFPYEEGKVSTKRRSPNKTEIDVISRVIESRARDIVAALRNELDTMVGGGA